MMYHLPLDACFDDGSDGTRTVLGCERRSEGRRNEGLNNADGCRQKSAN